MYCSRLTTHQRGLVACGDQTNPSPDIHTGTVMNGHPPVQDPREGGEKKKQQETKNRKAADRRNGEAVKFVSFGPRGL